MSKKGRQVLVFLRPEHVSGAERGAGVAENDGAGAEREVVEREQSGERAKSTTHSPLQPNISLTS